MKVIADELASVSRSGASRLRWESFAAPERSLVTTLYNSDEVLQLDLGKYDILSHDGLIWLLALVAWRRAARKPHAEILLPTDTAKIRFLKSLRFPQALDSAGGHVLNESVLWSGPSVDVPHPGSLRYFQFITDSSWYRVATTLVTHFEGDLKYFFRRSPVQTDEHTLWPLIKTLHEVIHNIAIHGGGSSGAGEGFCCYRAFPKGYPKLRFCASDLGRGFRNTLAVQGHQTENDKDAILTALIYRHIQPRDGVLGLFRALQFVRRAGGALRIRSGNASVSLVLDNRDAQALFDEGYQDPNYEWIDALTESANAPVVEGSHLLLDLNIPKRG